MASRLLADTEPGQNESNVCLEYFHCAAVACCNPTTLGIYAIQKKKKTQMCKYVPPLLSELKNLFSPTGLLWQSPL